MTMPTQHNCPHSADGWCLACVAGLAEVAAEARKQQARLIAERDRAIGDLGRYANEHDRMERHLTQQLASEKQRRINDINALHLKGARGLSDQLQAERETMAEIEAEANAMVLGEKANTKKALAERDATEAAMRERFAETRKRLREAAIPAWKIMPVGSDTPLGADFIVLPRALFEVETAE